MLQVSLTSPVHISICIHLYSLPPMPLWLLIDVFLTRYISKNVVMSLCLNYGMFDNKDTLYIRSGKSIFLKLRTHKEQINSTDHQQTLIPTTNTLQSKLCMHSSPPLLGKKKNRATQAYCSLLSTSNNCFEWQHRCIE